MKKLFVSVPMRGRSESAIEDSIEKMHKIAESIFGENLEVIHNHCDHDVPIGVNHSVYCVGQAIQKMAEADYFIGIRYSKYFKGCNIEAEVAKSYGIKTYLLDMHYCNFLDDAKKIEYCEWDVLSDSNR